MELYWRYAFLMFLKRSISNSNKSRQENKYAADIRTWRTICPRCNIAGTDLLRSPSRWFQQFELPSVPFFPVYL